MARLVGDTVPRFYTRPLRELTPHTSYGFACCDFARDVLGIDLFPWQRWLLIHLLELTPDGRLRFRTAIVGVSRQNGKTTIVKILALFFLYLLRAGLVIGTAQSLDVAEEAWADTVDLAQSTPELAAEVAHVDRTNGKKALRLVGGERYKVAAATRRGGRGLAGDLVVLDELREHVRWDSWAAVTKTTLAREFALILGISTAGDVSSIVLRSLRKTGLELLAAAGDVQAAAELGDAGSVPFDPQDDEPDDGSVDGDSFALFEWSAPPGSSSKDDDALKAANPSLGYGTFSERGLKAARLTDPPHVFGQECMMLWSATTTTGPFPVGAWLAGVDAGSRIADGQPVAACLDVSWDRNYAHVAVAGLRSDGAVHVEIATTRAGTAWVTSWLADAHARNSFSAVAVQDKGAPVSSLIDGLADADLPVLPWGGAAIGAATGQFFDLVRLPEPGEVKQQMFHLPQPILDVPAATAVRRQLGDAWVIDRKRSPEDAAPLCAAIGAVWALVAKAPAPKTSAYESRRLITV